MDLSLDEIIQKKKFGVKNTKKSFLAKKPVRPVHTQSSGRVIDARNKIIQKNRAKIRDARDKLAQIARASGDARLKLMKKQKEVSPKRLQSSSYRTKKFGVSKSKPKFTKMPPLVGVPRGYIDYDNMDMEEEQLLEYQPTPISLRRTVRNDVAPPFAYYNPADRGSTMWNNDPFDCYEIPVTRSSDVAESLNIRRQVRNISPEMTRKGIMRSDRQVSPPFNRRFNQESASHLSYEMITRLERAPDPHASMGIFANPLTKQGSNTSKPGFRIVVSNLHCSVTQSDIKELFEDIGELHEARLVRPGVAEVIFNNLKDAEKAVDTYHNRQLDGQPMKCLLVNPRASNKPTAPAISTNNSFSARSSNKTPLEIDIDALHKVLFRRH